MARATAREYLDASTRAWDQWQRELDAIMRARRERGEPNGALLDVLRAEYPLLDVLYQAAALLDQAAQAGR